MLKRSPNTTKFKFKKFFKIKYKTHTKTRTSVLTFGRFGLQSLESKKLTFNQIESGRKLLWKMINKKGKIWIKVFPWSAFTKKPIGARMGKGKGKHFSWVCPIKVGTVVYELSNIDSVQATIALTKCAFKMPFKSKIIKLKY